MNSKNNSSSGGLGISGVLGVVFIALKLVGVIDLSKIFSFIYNRGGIKMNVDKLCKDCLNYHKCIEDGYVDQDAIPVKLKDRLYSLFVEGCDCFERRFEDKE